MSLFTCTYAYNLQYPSHLETPGNHKMFIWFSTRQTALWKAGDVIPLTIYDNEHGSIQCWQIVLSMSTCHTVFQIVWHISLLYHEDRHGPATSLYITQDEAIQFCQQFACLGFMRIMLEWLLILPNQTSTTSHVRNIKLNFIQSAMD